MTHSYLTMRIHTWHDTFISDVIYSYVTSLIRGMTHSYGTWLILMWHNSFIYSFHKRANNYGALSRKMTGRVVASRRRYRAPSGMAQSHTGQNVGVYRGNIYGRFVYILGVYLYIGGLCYGYLWYPRILSGRLFRIIFRFIIRINPRCIGQDKPPIHRQIPDKPPDKTSDKPLQPWCGAAA